MALFEPFLCHFTQTYLATLKLHSNNHWICKTLSINRYFARKGACLMLLMTSKVTKSIYSEIFVGLFIIFLWKKKRIVALALVHQISYSILAIFSILTKIKTLWFDILIRVFANHPDLNCYCRGLIDWNVENVWMQKRVKIIHVMIEFLICEQECPGANRWCQHKLPHHIQSQLLEFQSRSIFPQPKKWIIMIF